ncbi:Nucleolar protein 13 [Golovinomyces cichoracearum]|uniref:Nucleolar protein 13 n=1 Tax=Golovinomyces cichoracearum TaxID=62708 RepID=A0A420ICN1_9PEZI|nr:Nucleolar protein 13 [Golovinomyces cichoracearum]
MSIPKTKTETSKIQPASLSRSHTPSSTTSQEDSREIQRGFIELNSSSNHDSSNYKDELSEIRPAKKRKMLRDEIEVDITAPEPPSKKQLRLLKKGKPLPKKKISTDSVQAEDLWNKEPEQNKRSEHGVWIGNLSYQTSVEQLTTFLTQNCEIAENVITRIHMPGAPDTKALPRNGDKKAGKPILKKGFAYVDFSCSEAVKKAIELSEKLLNGRRLLIKDKQSFEGRPQMAKDELSINNKPRNKKVFLGNLSFDTTEDDLKENFEKCGPIKMLKLATFEDSGKCKGFAWILFEDLNGAENAVRGFVRVLANVKKPKINLAAENEDSKPNLGEVEASREQRKLWVNKLKGRILRVEFAEDSQLRYKKQYGKDGTKNAGKFRQDTQESVNERHEKPLKKVVYRQQYAPRLTGGIVESKGKKITF